MVYILLGDGFEEMEALCACDILRRGGAAVTTLSVSGQPVRGAHGIAVTADRTVEEASMKDLEMVVLPGGLGGVSAIRASRAAMDLIARAWAADRYVAAICAGPTALAELHITDGRRVTCYPGLEPEMGTARMQPGAQVVRDGRLITGEAPGAAMAFGLALLEALKGPETAAAVAAGLVLRPQGAGKEH